jgi:peptidoglycan/xylan/chitin deacetylase (PgdA/CDA1 family)
VRLGGQGVSVFDECGSFGMSIWRKWLQICAWLQGARARTLLYHSISDSPDDHFAVTPQTFRVQMRWLVEQGWRSLTACQLIDAITEGKDLSKSVVITFDDGERDFLEVAVPILSEFGLKVTLFAPTGFLGRTNSWNRHAPARALLTTDELIEVAQQGFEVGSHTVSHPSLPDLDDERLAFELCESRRFIESITRQRQVTLAYPFGRAGRREQVAASEAGYAGAFLAGGLWGNGRGSQLFALTRETITRNTSLNEFVRLVTGRSDLARLWRDLLHRRRVEAINAG